MLHLLPEIHEQILIRLNVRDLIRCRSVCKLWLSLISDPLFIRSHLNRSHHNDRNNHEIGDRRIAMSLYPGYIKFYRYNFGFQFYRYNDCHLLGSSDGLVCISPYPNEILVVNPLTREVKKVTKPQIPETGSLCWGFGYDSSMDDYKVLLGFRTGENSTSFQVFSLRSRIWKVIGEENLAFISRVGILCKGALHWLAYDTLLKKNVVRSFRFSEEVFMEVPVPDNMSYKSDVAQDSSMRLGTLEDCLCVFRHELLPQEVWVMKDYNKKQSWEFIGCKREIKYDPMHCIKDLKNYIPNKRPLCHETCLCESGVFLGAPSYVESLVSPHFHKRQRRKRPATSTMKGPKVKLRNVLVAMHAIHHAKSRASAGTSSCASTSARV